MQLSLMILIGSSRSVSVSELESSIEKSPPLFAMFIRLRSLSRAELTKTTGKLNRGDYGRRLGIRPRSQGLLPFQNGGQTRRKTIKFIEHKRKSQLGTKK